MGQSSAGQDRFDYVVVGSGSAGAAVAARLSEDAGVSVLLVEAGGSHLGMNVQVPAAFPKQFKTKRDWEYYSEPEPHLDDRVMYHPRGKMLGGSSSQNAMIYIRGHRSDFDGWAEAGATGWSYDEVLPLFRRSERNSRGADAFHGADGPMHVQDPRSPHPLSEALVDAMVATGLARNDDFNGPTQQGAGLYQVTQKRGRRWGTADGFLMPARRRKNLMILSKTLVTRVLLDGGRASGVELEGKDGRREVRADREVVLAAGAINTPQLLMLSGIGPADHLREHGIEVAVDQPHVGAHLMDHPMYMVNYETSAKQTLADAEKPQWLVRYLATRRGLLTSNVGEAGAFFSTLGGDEPPDMQLLGGPAYFVDHGFAVHDTPAYAIGCSLVGPRSEGHLRLRSADPRAKAVIHNNWFSEPEDMDAMVAGIERARDVAASGPLKPCTGDEIHPGERAKSRDELEAKIRQEVSHTYHPTCTARIGPEGEGVVDPALRVHGIAGLRVADASVFPRVPRGNTHAAALMVGEKASDLLRAGA